MNKKLILIAIALTAMVSCKETKSPFTRDVDNYAVVTIQAPDLSGITDNGKEVLNLYRFAADEVVELYIRDNESPDAPVNPILCGFARVSLAPGESKAIRIPLHARAFTVVTQAGERVPGSGSWTLYAGFGQPDSRTEELTGRKCLSVLIQ